MKNHPLELDLEETFDDGAIPWLFGLVALVNGLRFIITGILLPLLLTSGIEAPLVKSRWTPLCDKRRFDQGTSYRSDARSHGSGLYDLCWDRDNLSFFDKPECSSSAIEGLDITIRNTSDCPFPTNICFADGPTPQVLTIKHHNITLRQLGLNSRSMLSINHELSCSPLQLDHFIRPLPEGGSVLSFRDFRHEETPKFIGPGGMYDLKLETLNGPNKWTNESSGVLIALSNESLHRGESTTLPRDEYFVSHIPVPTITLPQHPFIRTQNAKFFAFIYQAGPRTFFPADFEDPVFMAHVALDRRLQEVHPDYEAAAIGCMEKFQFCINTSEEFQCTEWGGWWDRVQSIDALFSEKYTVDDRRESAFAVREITREFCLYIQHGPLTYEFPTYTDRYLRGDNVPPWTDRVLSSYLVLWWGAVYRIQRVVAGSDKTPRLPADPGYPSDESLQSEEEADPWSWCHRVLLRDPDYTNVNFFAFIISLILAYSIFIFSYSDRLRGLWIQASWFLSPHALAEGLYYLWRLFTSILEFLGRLKGKTFSVNVVEVSSSSLNNMELQTNGLEGGFTYHTGRVPGLAAVHLQEYVVGSAYDYDNPLPMMAQSHVRVY
ncbi:hypothetical protein TWF281_006255 [Arthrobotrys megalospora]